MALETASFLSCLLKVPTVSLAAFVNAVLSSWLPAPFARLERENAVTCFPAETAMNIIPPLGVCMGTVVKVILDHFAGILTLYFLRYIFKSSFSVLSCVAKSITGRKESL